LEDLLDRSEMLRAIQRYQVARMRATHEALFRSPVYGPLCEFFVADLYGPREVGLAREATLRSLGRVLKPVLPAWIFDGAIGLIDLQSLSAQLDDRLARTLFSAGCSSHFSSEEFEAAYFRCDDYADRTHQIALSESCTSFAFELSRQRSTGLLLSTARRLQRHASVDSLIAVLERGHRAFGHVGEIGPFLAAMRVGETTYLDGIYKKMRG
jgi:hypothetical protein